MSLKISFYYLLMLSYYHLCCFRNIITYYIQNVIHFGCHKYLLVVGKSIQDISTDVIFLIFWVLSVTLVYVFLQQFPLFSCLSSLSKSFKACCPLVQSLSKYQEIKHAAGFIFKQLLSYFLPTCPSYMGKVNFHYSILLPSLKLYLYYIYIKLYLNVTLLW